MFNHIKLHLSASPLLTGLLTLPTLSALYLIAHMSMPLGARWGLASLLVLAWGYTLARHAWLLLPNSVEAIEIKDQGFHLVLRCGHSKPVALLKASLVTPQLSLLRFNALPETKEHDSSKRNRCLNPTRLQQMIASITPGEQRHKVLVAFDGIKDAEPYRRLRVLHRLQLNSDET